MSAPKHGAKAKQFSSTWVGIDGFLSNDNNLIQAGTEEDWVRGTPFYRAWWEILPAAETPIDTITVHPGDVMDVTITQGTPKWTITVTDTTSGQTFTTQQKFTGPQTSAEWIQEAPLVGGRIAHLAHDSTVDFTSSTVNGASPNLAGTDSGEMVKGRHVISIPSSPNITGNGFAVAFGSAAPLPPA